MCAVLVLVDIFSGSEIFQLKKKWSGVTLWNDWACSVETLWRGGPTEGATRSHDWWGECACGERKEKEEQSVRHILVLSVSLFVLPPPLTPTPNHSLSLSLFQTHTHALFLSLSLSLPPSSSQWRPWEESRYDASLRHTRGKTYYLCILHPWMAFNGLRRCTALLLRSF